VGRRNLTLASSEERVILHVNLVPAFPRAGDKGTAKGRQEKWEGIHLGQRMQCEISH